jgi:hypothetical protein
MAVGACARYVQAPSETVRQAQHHYLFAWTGDEDRQDSDFLTVIDLARDGDRYGTIVATAPVGERGLWPHHTEHELGSSGMLLANGYAANRNLLFDLREPLRPRIVRRWNGAGSLSFLHSFARLPNNHVLATFQAHGPDNVSPGGLAELDEAGQIVRSRSAADPAADQSTLRPYSLAVVPALDRVVVALTYMPIPTWHPLRRSIEHDHSGNQVQVYRLSDLSLIKTIRLPTSDAPIEPRVLRDGRTVLVASVECRLYRVAGLEGSDPRLEMVHQRRQGAARCPSWSVTTGSRRMPRITVSSRWTSLIWGMSGRSRRSRSMNDSGRTGSRPTARGSLSSTSPAQGPSGECGCCGWTRRLGNSRSTATFRDAGSDRPGIAFDRPVWPHGATGTAVPHGTVFGF